MIFILHRLHNESFVQRRIMNTLKHNKVRDFQIFSNWLYHPVQKNVYSNFNFKRYWRKNTVKYEISHELSIFTYKGRLYDKDRWLNFRISIKFKLKMHEDNGWIGNQLNTVNIVIES